MFNEGFSSYGYDQLFINSNDSSYSDYSRSIINKDMPQESLLKGTANNTYNDTESIKPTIQRSNDVYDYLERNIRDMYNKKMNNGDEVNKLKKQIKNIQYKYDMLMIFLICIIVYTIINFNSLGKQVVYHIHYNGQQPGPPQASGVPIINPMFTAN